MKKTVILLLAALLLPLCQSIHAQRRSNYRSFESIPNSFRVTVSHVPWSTDDSKAAAFNFSCHYDNLSSCNYPVSLDIYPANFGDWHGDPNGTLAFYPEATFGSKSLRPCIAALGIKSPQIRQFSLRLAAFCASGLFCLKVSNFNRLDEELFVTIHTLEQAEIGPGVRHLEKNTFSNCQNLKYVKFGPNVIKINDGCFTGCSSLEVVEFENSDLYSVILLKDDIKHMFHTDFNQTAIYCKNMKAFVVPDALLSEYKTVLKDVFKPVKDGTCKVISRTEFYSPHVAGVALNKSSLTLSVSDSTRQLTADVLPSNTWNKKVIWRSSNPTVATVSSTGQVTYRLPGTAIITATTEEGGYADTCTVTTTPAPANYVYLKNLSIPGYAFSEGFDANTTAYTVTVPSSTESVNISADANAYWGVSVTGTGTKMLSAGDNVFPITVTGYASSRPLSRTYTVTVHRKSTDAALKLLVVDGMALSPNTLYHNIAVPHATRTFNITAEARYPFASVSGAGNKTFAVDDSTFTITVTPEDGSPVTYTINVRRKSIDATLKFLIVCGSVLRTDIFYHNITVPYATGAFNIASETNHPLAEVSGTGNKTLEVGDNTFTVTVTPENGSPVATYTINIYREFADATLRFLTVCGSILRTDIFNHTITVPYVIDTFNIATEAKNPLATVLISGDENKTLNVGDNIFTITVTPEEGPPVTYTINVYRESADATLKFLIVCGSVLRTSIFHHSLTVPNATRTFSIATETNHPLVTVSVSGDENKTLEVGDNTFTVTVTPEGKQAIVYTIDVHRKSIDATLKFLTAGGRALSLDTLYHNITFPNATSTFNIAAEANYPLATVSGTGNQTLEEGYNPISVTVTSEEGSDSTCYTVMVYVIYSDATLKSLTLYNPLDRSNISTEFDPATLTYTAEVPFSVTDLTLIARTNNWKATITGDMEIQFLSPSSANFPIMVTAENGHAETYTVHLVRLPLRVESITLTESSLNLAREDTARLDYTITPPDATNRSVVWASDNTDIASVSQNGTVTANNAGRAVISATTNDGGYVARCTVRVEPSSDNTLKSLSVEEVSLSPAFHPDILDYEVHLDNQMPVITVKAEANHFSARITGDTGVYKRTWGRPAKLTVYSEAGYSRVYSIKINYSVKDDTDATWHLKNDTLFMKGPNSIPAFYNSNSPWFDYNMFSRILVIGSDIQNIGAHAFAGLTSLEKVINLNPVPQPVSAQVFTGLVLKDIELEVPPGCESIYGLAPVWKEFGKVFTDIMPTGIQAVRVYTANGRLYVNSPAAERISIYSVTGTLLYSFDKPAGAFTFHPSPFTLHLSPVLIVKGSSGWSKKLVVSG
jgi:uncharacterized protein YjdB